MKPMNNQKICISKQVTFISLIFFMIIAYVVVAYQTMQKTTSTNSRASDTKRVILVSPPSPSEEQLKSATFYTATLFGSQNIQLIGEKPAVTDTPRMAIFMKRQDGSFVFIDIFTATSEELNNRFSNLGFSPQNTVTVDDIRSSNEFVLYELK